jgi:Arm domain-containing DNA-binding protein
MARAIHRLSPIEVKGAKPTTSQKPAMLNDGGGLYLRVAQGIGETIHKTWIFRYSVDGRDRQLSLGSFPDVSLGEARDQADAQRKLRRQDIDPIAERRRLAEAKKADEAAQKTAAALAELQDLCPGIHRRARGRMVERHLLHAMEAHARNVRLPDHRRLASRRYRSSIGAALP